MSKSTLFYMTLTLSLSIGSSSVQAEKRLAYSKSAGVEVLTQGKTWCNETASITLKAEDDNFFNNGKADLFVLKIAKAVLPKECGQAKTLAIYKFNPKSKKISLYAKADQSAGWVLALEPKAPITPDVVAKKSVQVSPEVEATQLVSELEAVATATKKAETEVVKEAMKALEVLTVPDTQVTDMPAVIVSNDFEVGGYSPRIGSTSFSDPSDRTITINTEAGCKLYRHGLLPDPGLFSYSNDIPEDWFAFPGAGLACSQGVLTGKGKIAFKDLDANNKGEIEVTAINGHLFQNIPDDWSPQRFEKQGKRDTALFHVGSLPEFKTHFIGVMKKEIDYKLIKQVAFNEHTIYAISDKNVIHEPDQVDKVLAELRKLHKKMGYKRASLEIFDSLGAFKKELLAVKSTPSGRGKNIKYTVVNLAVQRKESERLKEIKNAQLRDQKYRQFSQLPLETVKRKALGDYVDSFEQGQYEATAKSALKLGSARERIWMVHVTDVSDDSAEVDFPIEMPLSNSAIEQEGWYIVKANLDGILGETTDAGYIQPKLDKVEVLHSCQQAQCNEYADHLTSFRKIENVPEWSPKKFGEQ